MLDISHIITQKRKESSYAIEIYTKEDGESPFRLFLLSLSPKMKSKVLWTIELLKKNGPNLREPYSAPLIDGLYELRTKLGSDNVRCLYFFHKGQIAILTNAFIKKSGKTPRREIDKANRYRADWIRRNSR